MKQRRESKLQVSIYLINELPRRTFVHHLFIVTLSRRNCCAFQMLRGLDSVCSFCVLLRSFILEQFISHWQKYEIKSILTRKNSTNIQSFRLFAKFCNVYLTFCTPYVYNSRKLKVEVRNLQLSTYLVSVGLVFTSYRN